jgi:hypothetical protein
MMREYHVRFRERSWFCLVILTISFRHDNICPYIIAWYNIKIANARARVCQSVPTTVFSLKNTHFMFVLKLSLNNINCQDKESYQKLSGV